MTSRIVYGERQRLGEWAIERYPGLQIHGEFEAIGREVDGKIVGACLYTHHSGSECMFTAISDGSKRWVTKDFIRHAMAYPFITCGYHRISARVEIDNLPSIRFCDHFGWTREGIAREAGRSRQDCIMFGLLDRDCPFIQDLRLARIFGRDGL